MKSDFVHGYIQTMDAEKDPRNLILAFQIARKIIDNFSLGVFVEEMFEVVSCYFPVSFSPPPDNPHGITKQDLVLSLRSCLSATPLFSEYCLPLLLEKLTSDITSAQIDSLQTLAECAPVYGTAALKEYISSFYSCLRKEVVDGDSEEVKRESLKCLSCLISTLSTDITDISSSSVLKSFIEEIFSEYRIYILKSDVKILYNASSLLHCICDANSIACCMVLETAVPLVLLQYNNQTQINCRRCLIDILNMFISCAARHNTEQVLKIILIHKADLISTYTELLLARDKDISCYGIRGVAAILKCNNVLSESEAELFSKHIATILLSNSDKKIRNECVITVQLLASQFPVIVKSEIQTKLIEKLNQDQMEIDGDSSVSKEDLMGIITSISHHKLLLTDITYFIFLQLNQQKDKICSSEVLTSCLCSMVENNKTNGDVLDYTNTSIVPNILQLIVDQYQSLTSNDIEHLATILRISCTNSSSSICEGLYKQIVDLFLHGKLKGITLKDFQPLQNRSNKSQLCSLPLVTAVVCSVPLSETMVNIDDIVSSVMSICTTTDDLTICEYGSKCIAGLLNKLTESYIEGILMDIDKLWDGLFTVNQSSENVERSVILLTWITKALVLRNHCKAKEYIQKLLELLSVDIVGSIVAEYFYIIVTQYKDILNSEMRADIKMFYHQRLFLENKDRLVTDYQESESGAIKKNYLIVLSNLMKPLQKQVLLPELPLLLPLLIHSLVYEDRNLIQVTLTTIQSLCENKEGSLLLCKHLDSVIPQLLQLSKYLSDMKIRISALKCLNTVSHLPSHLILPYRNTVIKSLVQVLDDKKRLVRNEAVTARSKWFLIAEPGSS
ncbi:hypothetical protein LOTGIDRAFT_234861 [Lottia gigantea]|uniref:MMS19 nucleotide excision repair protein n=1 Tax=Lottia gigantea TaxID=225164 RepID=V4BH53_LOTGI|nr:hypothetical protein LOTGIDRAFT_234861 [Lottia gigantea]ESO87854.1 hypothetical protein LOTGIDRAFT_234861 [Lottia gigantea]